MLLNWVWMLAGVMLLAAALWVLLPGRKKQATERDHVTVALRQEQVQIHKRREQLADVTTRTEVIRGQKTVTVPVVREEFVVEKDGAEVARIPLNEQRVAVSTRTVPLNEVSVYEREWEETEHLQAVVREEVAGVETTGDVTVEDVSESARPT